MNNEELKDALLNQKAVIFTTNDGTEIHCPFVDAVVYKAKNKRIVVSAVVVDQNGKCHYNCKPTQIRFEV
jgi:hypothetical protein